MPSASPVNVVCGILFHDGRVLVTRRSDSGRYPLVWEFPGGKVEPDESPEAALHRELAEELDLAIRELIPIEPVSYKERDFSISLIPFVCKPDQSAGPVPHDHVEIRWIPVDEALQLTWAPADIPLVDKLEDLFALYDHE